MDAARIIELAESDDTPKFMFGSEELEAWTRKHIERRTNGSAGCHTYSGWYVVLHKNIGRPGCFRVLSCWNIGQVFPTSYDVPESVAA